VLPKIFKPFKSKNHNLIRIGPNSDGGYVIDKRVISTTNTIITCGLSDDWEFEKSFLKENKNCKIIAYDHTVNRQFWKKRFQKDLLNFFLLKKLRFHKIIKIFKYIDYKFFFRNEKIHYKKKVVLNKRNKNEASIKDILLKQNNIILKVDIEGGEYSLLKRINKESHKINLLIIEFHNIGKNLNNIIKFLINSKFKIIHIHGNNYAGTNIIGDPHVIELTLINSTKFKTDKKKSNKKYPILGLDFSNNKRKPDFSLNFND